MITRERLRLAELFGFAFTNGIMPKLVALWEPHDGPGKDSEVAGEAIADQVLADKELTREVVRCAVIGAWNVLPPLVYGRDNGLVALPQGSGPWLYGRARSSREERPKNGKR